jgi:hypothetical protein
MKRTPPFPHILKHLLPLLSIVALALQMMPWNTAGVTAGPAVPVRTNALYPLNARDEPLTFNRVGITAEPPTSPVTSTLYLNLVSARTEPLAFDGAGVNEGDPVTTPYQWLISVDNTGDPLQPRDAGCSRDDPNYPANCDWPSIRTIPGWAPVYTEGNQDDLNATTGISLPPGRYLISVVAEGYKIGGQHFTVPLAEPGLLTVALQPLPLPPATMRIKVFEDISMTNGMFDAPAEHGLAGFHAVINDTLGEITQDLFGNPLCTEYEKNPDGSVKLDANGDPIIKTLGAGCYSDANGDIVIPNLPPLRYDVLVVPPDGTDWTETSTLEGSWSYDTWLQEGGTGLDNEFVVAGEPFPWTIFGFVRPTPPLTPTANAGAIQGTVVDVEVFVPFQGGLPYQGGVWGGLSGAKIVGPINRPWLALNDLQNGDTAIWVGRGNPDGTFSIPNVPPGNYSLTYWDENLHRILDWVQVTVQPNQTTDAGTLFLTGWFTIVRGSVFVDHNSNGRRDPGEPGVPNYLVVLKDRDNTEIDRMSIAATTDTNGNYIFEKAYPMGSWMVLEAYNDSYYTTGYTFQATNQPTETTVLGNGVDVGFLPILGQSVRLDWGVRPYAPGTNGGIVGTVFYDTVRNELNARYAAPEPFGPGIPNLTVNLYATVKDAQGNPITDTTPGPNFGALVKGPLLNTATTETFARQKNCQARDVDGNPVDTPALAPATGDHDCLEGPVMGVQIGTEFNTLDGNYGFTEILTDPITGLALPAPIPIPPGDYLVEVVVPTDPVFGRPLYQVTREEDVNVFDGDTYVPMALPPACAGPLHTVDVAGVGSDGPNAVYNPAFAEAGGSIYEGQLMPLCNVKLVTVTDRRSIAPPFLFFTEVPIPGRWKGYIIDDLTLSTDPNSLFFGEKAGLAYMPIGIYDFSNRLVTTVLSDPNGVYEVLLPSTSTYNVPTPSGVAPSVYYLMGNDPGQPGNPNPTYNPQYRTIGASFEIYPGAWLPSDLAPTQIAVSFQAPGSQFNEVTQCRLDAATPQLYAVSQPYVVVSGTVTLRGLGFGASQGRGNVTLDGIPLPVLEWSDRTVTAAVPETITAGVYQLEITADNGQKTVNGLSFHILGDGYNPTLFEVGPTQPYTTIQSALDAAAPSSQSLVVVYPGATEPLTNPLGLYYENIVIYAPVKLQGVGPGGIYSDTTGVTYVPGSIIDGRTVGGDTAYSLWWRQLVGDIWLNRGGWDGSPVDGDGRPLIYEGATVYILANDGEFTSTFRAAIDGFAIQGGDQQGFPNNLNVIGGTPIPGIQPIVVVQGGGIFANAYARYLRITNNILRSNGGAYGGAIRLGTPNVQDPLLKDAQNDDVLIAHNRILANGGTNLAGAIGIFEGTENYEIAYNDICGNFSAEYGGGISHYGYSPNGQIHHNRIYFNRSYDEGGGIMIAGELPANPSTLSPGAGPVDIYTNLIQDNLANDDGGGLRLLMAGNYPYNIYNNIIVNNISTHEGGGISLNDAPDVRIYNNTIMGNLTTATATTSNGLAAPAGLATARNSTLLQATLPLTSPIFSNPLLFNNLFWDNRAGTWNGDGVSGIGMPGDPFPIYRWDLGATDNTGVLSPTYSLLHVPYGLPEATNRVGLDPRVVEPYTTTVTLFPWRGNPNFVDVAIVARNLPVNLMGNYHLQPVSPAIDAGTSNKAGISAPTDDFDGDSRPLQAGFEIGADELFVFRLYAPITMKEPTTP